MLALLLTTAAHAYESDQLVARLDPPEDGTELANAQADEFLARAVALANRKTRCRGTDEKMRIAAAKAVHEVMGKLTIIPRKGELPPQYYGAYAAWIETGPVPKRSFANRDDIYAEVRLRVSPILQIFGPASTISLGGVLMGTDKVDHFWVQGFDYFEESRWGADPDRAVLWGTRTELGIWGELTTGVFSYADLEANWLGMQFYDSLLRPGSVIVRRPDGCLEQARPFDWREWVSPRLDEVLNPSVFRPDLAAALADLLTARTFAPCFSFGSLLTPEEEQILRETFLAPDLHVGPDAPDRAVELDLTDLCPALGRVVAPLLAPQLVADEPVEPEEPPTSTLRRRLRRAR